MTLTKQTVHLPVKVEDELPSEYTRVSLSMDEGTTFPFETAVVKWLDYKKEGYTHWLKPQEGYFFTPEQLNEYTANVIKQALETVADNAKVVEEELGSDEYREIPIDTFESSEFIADKGYEECSFYRYKVSKQSITNTFEETYKKFEV